jgi:hypothetical protein
MQALNAARDDTALSELARLFCESGARPMLFKGWAVAQHYAERHLRPMGDVDLCAPPGRFDEVVDLLLQRGFRRYSALTEAERGRVLGFMSPDGWPGNDLSIDLHERLDRFGLAPLPELFSRAVPRQAGDHEILVPATEDHLRLVVIHYLAHGAWRPLSLCDVAAMVESLPPQFDWDLCFGSVPHRRRWLACTLQLAHDLLAARLDGVPATCREVPPEWFRATILREWEKPFSEHHARPNLGYVWRHRPHRLPAELAGRWPNPIRATVEIDGDIGPLPRWPYQLAHFSRSVLRAIATGIRSGLPLG